MRIFRMSLIIILGTIVFFNNACIKNNSLSSPGQEKTELKTTPDGRFSEPELHNNTVTVKNSSLGPASVYVIALFICLICFGCGWAISMCAYSTLFSSAVEEGMRDTFIE